MFTKNRASLFHFLEAKDNSSSHNKPLGAVIFKDGRIFAGNIEENTVDKCVARRYFWTSTFFVGTLVTVFAISVATCVGWVAPDDATGFLGFMRGFYHLMYTNYLMLLMFFVAFMIGLYGMMISHPKGAYRASLTTRMKAHFDVDDDNYIIVDTKGNVLMTNAHIVPLENFSYDVKYSLSSAVFEMITASYLLDCKMSYMKTMQDMISNEILSHSTDDDDTVEMKERIEYFAVLSKNSDAVYREYMKNIDDLKNELSRRGVK